MKNKNGFTLVELLVTITLMLTLLGLAIASYINVSNSKKREAWQMVKSQIETAAAESDIPHQRFASLGIITESAYVQMECDGVACLDLGFPARYTNFRKATEKDA